MKNFIRSITPRFLLQIYRNSKKKGVRKSIEKQEKFGNGATLDSLIQDFKKCGIQSGDSVLVHIGFSKLGFVEGGPKTFVDALLSVVGENGNILMPTSPNAGLQLNYIQSNQVFDVVNSPSKMGLLSEYFRKLPAVVRSESPIEPVCALGPDAIWFTAGHAGEVTPYTSKSPFARLVEKQGKIVYIGVTLDNAGTSLHLLEDAVESFPFPVYAEQRFLVKVIPVNQDAYEFEIKVHNPTQSAQRRCDELLPLFEKKGVAKQSNIAQAHTWVFEAQGMYQLMLDEFHKNGVTMYTPNGN